MVAELRSAQRGPTPRRHGSRLLRTVQVQTLCFHDIRHIGRKRVVQLIVARLVMTSVETEDSQEPAPGY
jgi:hypothetical protein